jgi:hypothetical protein
VPLIVKLSVLLVARSLTGVLAASLAKGVN